MLRDWKENITRKDIEMRDIWIKIQNLFKPIEKNNDGYHTFDELYDYRALYNAAFFNMLAALPNNPYNVHKSACHNDGGLCFGGGWFVVMATLPTGQISNHYKIEFWDHFQIPPRDVADEWDGHSPREAARRLRNALIYPNRLKTTWLCGLEKRM